MLVAIEGIDGAGKGTQADRLRDALLAEGKSCSKISFPRYDATFFGAAIGDYLNGRFGADVDSRLAAVLFAGDRFESRDLLARAVEDHDVVILDRYVGSNVAHQGARCPADRRSELAAWILKLEHDVFALPRADVVVLLDISVEVARRQIATKAGRSYTDRDADIHEADGGHLGAARALYLALADSESEWTRVSCSDDGVARSVEAIASDVRRAIPI